MSVIYDQSRDGQSMAGGASDYSTAAGPSGGIRRKRDTPTGEHGSVSTVSLSVHSNNKKLSSAVVAPGT